MHTSEPRPHAATVPHSRVRLVRGARPTVDARDAGSSAHELSRLLRHALEHGEAGRFESAYDVLRPALDKDGGLGPIEVRAAILIEGAHVLVRLGRYDEALQRARRGLALAEVSGDAALCADALSRLGLACLRRGELARAREHYEEARARYRRLNDEAHVAVAQNNLGLLCKNLGEWDAARSHFAEAVASARRHGRTDLLGTRLLNLGVLELKSGAWDRARTALAESRTCFETIDHTWYLTLNDLALGMLDRLEGHIDEARALLERGLERTLTHRMPREEAVAREYLGDLAAQEGDLKRAWQMYRRALALAERLVPAPDLEAEVLHRLARVQIADGDLEAARMGLVRGRAVAEKLGDPYELARTIAVMGELESALGRAPEARAALSDAVARFERLGERHERGRCLALLCELADEPSAARRFAYRAAALFHEAGARADLARIEARIAALPAGDDGALPTGAASALAKARSHRAPEVTIFGRSRAIVRVREAVHRAARSRLPVLIEGAPGTGKDFLARVIHVRSKESGGPIVFARCDAFATDTALVQLLGDSRVTPGRAPAPGAGGSAGLLDAARGGVLVLDRVECLPPAAQALLARLVETGEYLRPGELTRRHTNARFIALTSSPLAAAVASGTFRAELLAALSAIPLLLPPLAERTHDILPLARGFLRLHGGPDSPLLEPAARQALLRHTWPGNARELEIALRGALAQTAPGARYVRLSAIEAELANQAAQRVPGVPVAAPGHGLPAGAPTAEETGRLRARLAEIERVELEEALKRARGNKVKAASLLGVSRKTLYARLKRYSVRSA